MNGPLRASTTDEPDNEDDAFSWTDPRNVDQDRIGPKKGRTVSSVGEEQDHWTWPR